MAKFAEKEMAVIKKLAQEEIPALIATGVDEKIYYQKRAELNVHIIQLCVGGEMYELKGKKAGQNGFRFNKSLPTKAQVAELGEIINTFIATVENPYIQGLNGADVDDMSIPTNLILNAQVTAPEKVTNKTLREKIVGDSSYYQLQLSAIDVMNLAAIGEQARKDANFKTTIIVGASVLVLAGAAVGGYFIYKNYKNKDEEVAEAEVVVDAECDVDPDDVDIDEAPEVELD